MQQVLLLLLRASVGSALFGGVYAWPHCMLYEQMALVRSAEARPAGAAPRANPYGSVVHLCPNVMRFCEVRGVWQRGAHILWQDTCMEQAWAPPRHRVAGCARSGWVNP